MRASQQADATSAVSHSSGPEDRAWKVQGHGNASSLSGCQLSSCAHVLGCSPAFRLWLQALRMWESTLNQTMRLQAEAVPVSNPPPSPPASPFEELTPAHAPDTALAVSSRDTFS